MIKMIMIKRNWNILPRLVFLLLIGNLLGFDYTIFRHWFILAGLSVVFLLLGYALKYICKIVSDRYAAKIQVWYDRFTKRPMNLVTIFYVTAIALPMFLCLFSISGLFWSILSFFYRLFRA